MADTETYDDLDFSGSLGAEKAEQIAQQNRKQYDRTDFLSLGDQEMVIARFLNDVTAVRDPEIAKLLPVPWITVQQHSMVATKPAPSDFDGKWPTSMSCVCRADMVFRRRYPQGCWVCDYGVDQKTGKGSTPSPRIWALVALREEVMEGGRYVGIRDLLKEVEETDSAGKPTGNKRVVKAVRAANYGYKNFFGVVQGLSARAGTVLDRDFEIKRKGTGTGTSYAFAPIDPPAECYHPDDDDKPEAERRRVRFDLRDPRILAKYYPDIPDLRQVVAQQASDDHFNRFFIPGDGAGAEATRPAPPPSEGDDTAHLKALKERIMANQGSGTTQAAATGSGPLAM